MSEPMPVIEVGDWVCGAERIPWRILTVPSGFALDVITEIRKPNGVVWCREDLLLAKVEAAKSPASPGPTPEGRETFNCTVVELNGKPTHPTCAIFDRCAGGEISDEAKRQAQAETLREVQAWARDNVQSGLPDVHWVVDYAALDRKISALTGGTAKP
jgi:hypothetical protein